MSGTQQAGVPEQTPPMKQPFTYNEAYQVSIHHAEQLRILIDQPASVGSPAQHRRQLRDFGDGALLGAERQQAMDDASNFRHTLYRDVRDGIEDIFADPIYDESDEEGGVRCDDLTRHCPTGEKSKILDKRCLGCRDDAVICTYHTLSRHSLERPTPSSNTTKEAADIKGNIVEPDSRDEGQEEEVGIRCDHSTRRHSTGAKSIKLEEYCNDCRNAEVVCAYHLLSHHSWDLIAASPSSIISSDINEKEKKKKICDSTSVPVFDSVNTDSNLQHESNARKASQGIKRKHCEACPTAKRRNLAGIPDIRCEHAPNINLPHATCDADQDDTEGTTNQ